MENMTHEQIERWLDIQEQKNEELSAIASNIGYLSESVRGAYDGSGTSCFWGMSQALFMMVGELEGGESRKDIGLNIKIVKDEE